MHLAHPLIPIDHGSGIVWILQQSVWRVKQTNNTVQFETSMNQSLLRCATQQWFSSWTSFFHFLSKLEQVLTQPPKTSSAGNSNTTTPVWRHDFYAAVSSKTNCMADKKTTGKQGEENDKINVLSANTTSPVGQFITNKQGVRYSDDHNSL